MTALVLLLLAAPDVLVIAPDAYAPALEVREGLNLLRNLAASLPY